MNHDIREPTCQSADRMRLIARLWTQAQPAVSAFISSSVVDFHNAEDLLGQVAETVVTKAHDYDPERPFVPWALGIARYRILQYFAIRRADRHVTFDEETLGVLAEVHAELADETPARLAALRQCVRQIRGKSQKVMELRYLHDHRPAWIAQKLGMTQGAVWTMLHRVRKTLADCVERRLAASAQGAES